ncbi:cellulose-binding domain-containing protein [Actinoplanes bogorensis]|uniref:Cellulose-binding domain-containing protein n=1 Tax=Paractinoplanes bogorensis TaxID=1610840 RepID=A0ABS5Z449_9ACTN|nr:cellulose binding domain-containing protein [Actinoplanes bogorensis]MBU2670460.1 cellulose-binding domain-containing protein [Actinoplanes bogorensis]
MAKHSVRDFGTARFVLSFAVAILVFLTVWVAVRAVGPAEASRPPVLAMPSVTPTPSKTVSRTPSATPSALESSTSPSPSLSRSPSPSPSPSSPSPRRETRKPAPTRSNVEATLQVGASWEAGYVAAGRVVNRGDKPVEWRVTVSHSRVRDLQLRGTWNATGTQDGDTLVFTGGPLAPGDTAQFGYQTSSSGRGRAHPDGCNALGGSCRVR